jgi:hypothetical protein
MPVADHDRVDLFGGRDFKQLRQYGITHVKQEARAVLLYQKAAACLPRLGPRAAAPQHRDLRRSAVSRLW